LVIVIPIWITFLAVSLVFRLTRDASYWLAEGVLRSRLADPLLERWGLDAQALARGGFETLPPPFQWGIGLFAALLVIILLITLGFVTANVVGQRFIRLGEAIVARVPFVKVIYLATKQVVSMIAGGGTRPFKQVVLVPFPTASTRTIGFVTKSVRDESSGETLHSVFLATAPNPTTGFVTVVKHSDVIEVAWTVEEALTTLISGGVLMPDAVTLASTGAGPTTQA
jgi:uncharacterized membrane protein